MRVRLTLWAVISLAFTLAVQADTARFDLTGPPVAVKVQRNGVTLPISEVPNLRPKDRLWIHADLPEDQAAHYLLIVSFLRGSTNPPPEDWFTRAETWAKKIREEGIFVTVPDDAEDVVVFLAPETGGDFSTLRSAVRGKPGSFVRSVQDLDQASLDRQRLDVYLDSIRKVAENDPEKVHEVSQLLARSLNIHLEEDCFKKPVDEQASCLTQKGDDLVLNDGHSQSVVGALTNGASSDLVGALSATPQAGLGYFSPYVGVVMDVGRILDGLHTAQYQYIPALTLPKKEELELKLNNPPSFHNPKSVIVIAMPAVRQEAPPPLRPVNPEIGACVQRDPLVLPVEGAPLVFSTQFAHDLTLHVESKSGKTADVPLTADAAHGGLVASSSALTKANLDAQPGEALKGTVRGKWGFDAFSGPTFQLQYAEDTKWNVPPAETAGLTAGSAHVLHLQAPGAACADNISLRDDQGKNLKVQWKVAKADEVELAIPAESAKVSGPATLTIKEAGIKQDQQISLRIYGEAGQFKQLKIIPGDAHAILEGTQLDQVEKVDLNGTRFSPQADQPAGGVALNELQLAAANSSATASLHPGDKLTAQAKLKDGRSLPVAVTVEAPRPQITLLTKAVDLGPVSGASAVHLANQNELPQDGRLSFSVKAQVPAKFARDEKIEIATQDYSFHVLLGIADGSLTLQDPQTAVGQFDPAKSFGNSAFGPLQLRGVDERGVQGDWIPLATLVRVPTLAELDCPEDANQPCLLKGKNLFLLASVAANPQFSNPASIPEGFLNNTLEVPHPANGTLYVKLRDDPSDINTANVPMPARNTADQKQATPQGPPSPTSVQQQPLPAPANAPNAKSQSTPQ